MTVIEGDSGLILIDPLTTAEVARAALEHYCAHRPKKPVVAVIYTHSHVDHYGGVRGVVDEADVKAGKVAVIAPAGFMEAVSGENVLAGPPMIAPRAVPVRLACCRAGRAARSMPAWARAWRAARPA